MTTTIVLGVLLAILAAFLIVIAVRYYKLKNRKWEVPPEKDEEVEKLKAQLNTLKPQLDAAETKLLAAQDAISAASSLKSNLDTEIGRLEQEKEKKVELSSLQQEQVNQAQENLKQLQNNIEEKLNEYKNWEEKCRKIGDQYNDNDKKLENMRLKISEFEAKKKAIEDALVILNDYGNSVMKEHKEALVRAYKEREGSFGVLRFSERELVELSELNKVLVLLSNPAPLYKAIYEMYYRDKMKEMQANLGIESRICGIYRLYVVGEDAVETSYVGQSVDIKERWYQHLKRFVGSEPATGIKLYKSEIDLTKLRWEIIELVDQGRLNEREKYWIEFYNCGGGWNSRI